MARRIEKPEVGETYCTRQGYPCGIYWIGGEYCHYWYETNDKRVVSNVPYARLEFYAADPTKPEPKKLRPYHDHELALFVPCGTVLRCKKSNDESLINATGLVVGCAGNRVAVGKAGDGWQRPAVLLEQWTHIDGKPCGVEE